MIWTYCIGQMPAPTILIDTGAQAKEASNCMRLMGAEGGEEGIFR